MALLSRAGETIANASVRAVTTGPKHHFFGYYDKTPWDSTGRWLLGMEVGFMDRPPGPTDEIVIGMVDTASNDRWIELASTRAWNWQQGCMLQWLNGGPWIIFNDREGDAFVARLLNVQSGETRMLSRPVYTVSPEGALALSINFSRLQHQRPGYGYAGVVDPWEAVGEPQEDGIFAIDLETGDSRLVLSIAEAAQHERRSSFEGKMHRFNHLQFDRSGQRFGFLHRYRSTGAHETRLLSLDRQGGGLQTISDHGMVSHYDWHPDGSLIAWAHRYGVGDGYFIFRDGEVEALQDPAFTGDGHCSFSPCGRYLLTDTYPDEDRRQELLIYDLSAGEMVSSVELMAMQLPDEIRCDLHPRWSRDGRKLCVDSTFEGTRQIYVVELEDRL